MLIERFPNDIDEGKSRLPLSNADEEQILKLFARFIHWMLERIALCTGGPSPADW